MKAAEIARALMCGRSGCPCARWKPGGTVHCPAHDDGKPSLSVSAADNGKVLVNCFAGCVNDAVIDALRKHGLWSSGTARPKRAREPILRHELRDASGQVVAVHRRKGSGADKRVWWELPDGTSGLNGRRVETLPLYGCERLVAIESAPVVVVEGEPATDALSRRTILAVGTVTGAKVTPQREPLTPLLGRSVVLWPHANRSAGYLRGEQ